MHNSFVTSADATTIYVFYIGDVICYWFTSVYALASDDVYLEKN